MNKQFVFKYYLPLLSLLTVAYFIWGYTLEDTWIFLAIASEPFDWYFLYGATSLAWGIVSYVINGLAGDYGLFILKLLSFVLAVIAAVLVLVESCRVTPINAKYYYLYFLFFLISPFFTWSVTGMDTSMSMFWVAGIVCLYVRNLEERNHFTLRLIFIISSFSYIIRPELAWISLFLISYSYFNKSINTKQFILFAVVSVFITLLSIFIYYILTGSPLPSSSGKVTNISLVSLISSSWLFIQILPVVLLSVFCLYKRINTSLNTFLLAFLGIRFIEQIFIGAIDHRSFSAVFPLILMMFIVNLPLAIKKIHISASIVAAIFGLIICYLNLMNVLWYAERTEQVHLAVQAKLNELTDMNAIGTDEIGLLAYNYGVDTVYDYHGLIRNKLETLNGLDALVFTGELMKMEALSAGFYEYSKVCYEHSPTVYIRSVGFTPELYCKTIYLPR
jgi:hypothetical protein